MYIKQQERTVCKRKTLDENGHCVVIAPPATTNSCLWHRLLVDSKKYTWSWHSKTRMGELERTERNWVESHQRAVLTYLYGIYGSFCVFCMFTFFTVISGDGTITFDASVAVFSVGFSNSSSSLQQHCLHISTDKNKWYVSAFKLALCAFQWTVVT